MESFVNAPHDTHVDVSHYQFKHPLRSDPPIAEWLIFGDTPIILYRKHRRALVDVAGQKDQL
jgi:hypothetical protein